MDQITLLAEDHKDFPVDAQREQPLTLHEEAHFPLGMDVFSQEFAPECCTLGMVWMDADRIDCRKALGGLDAADVIGIGAENFLLPSAPPQPPAGWPLFKIDSAGSQLALNGIGIAADALRNGGLFPDTLTRLWKDAQATHRSDP